MGYWLHNQGEGNEDRYVEDFQANPQQVNAGGQSYDPNRVYTAIIGGERFGIKGSALIQAGGDVNKAVNMPGAITNREAYSPKSSFDLGGEILGPLAMFAGPAAAAAGFGGAGAGLSGGTDFSAADIAQLNANPGAYSGGYGAGGGFGGGGYGGERPAFTTPDEMQNFPAQNGGQQIGNWSEDVFGGNTGGVTPPAGTTIPGVGDVYGTPGQTAGMIAKAVKDGILPASQAATLLKQLGIGGGGGSNLDTLQKILGGNGSSSDFLRLGGAIAPAALGAITSSQQTKAYTDLAHEYMGFGAPSRARYEASFQPGFSMMSDPGYAGALDQSAKATLNALSVNGNPSTSPNAWGKSLQDLYEKTAYPALNNYRSTNATTGGFSAFNSAAPGANNAVIGSQANTANAIGAGIADVTNPNPPFNLQDYFKSLSNTNNILGAPK